jgi:hypothetical protein
MNWKDMFLCIHMPLYMHTCTCIYCYSYMYLWTFIHMYICIYIYISDYSYTFTYTYIHKVHKYTKYIYICTYIHKYRDIRKGWPSIHKPSVAMPDNGIKVKLRYYIYMFIHMH